MGEEEEAVTQQPAQVQTIKPNGKAQAKSQQSMWFLREEGP
jgi:hypothetical protein